MSDVTIKVRDNGPLLIEGSIKIEDAEGNAFATNPEKPMVAICRCGASANRPFCDGAHNQSGFESCERAT